ncbi:MAG: phosphoribosyltransferase family protein [bacterium]
MFLADLARAIDLPLEVDFLGVSSYGEAQESSGVVRMTQDLRADRWPASVLVVEDIVDTGLTLKYLLEPGDAPPRLGEGGGAPAQAGADPGREHSTTWASRSDRLPSATASTSRASCATCRSSA